MNDADFEPLSLFLPGLFRGFFSPQNFIFFSVQTPPLIIYSAVCCEIHISRTVNVLKSFVFFEQQALNEKKKTASSKVRVDYSGKF